MPCIQRRKLCTQLKVSDCQQRGTLRCLPAIQDPFHALAPQTVPPQKAPRLAGLGPGRSLDLEPGRSRAGHAPRSQLGSCSTTLCGTDPSASSVAPPFFRLRPAPAGTQLGTRCRARGTRISPEPGSGLCHTGPLESLSFIQSTRGTWPDEGAPTDLRARWHRQDR